MTQDERDQLIEDIKRSDSLRRGILEMAERSKDFDIAAAWKEVEALDAPIGERIAAARPLQQDQADSGQMPAARFLDLSTRLVKDLKQWVAGAGDHHGLSASDLEALLAALKLIDQLTVKVAGAASRSER